MGMRKGSSPRFSHNSGGVGDKDLLVRAHFVRVADQTHLWASPIQLDGVDAPEQVAAAAIAAGVARGLERERGR